MGVLMIPLATLSSWESWDHESWRASPAPLLVVTLRRAEPAPRLGICNGAGAEGNGMSEPAPRDWEWNSCPCRLLHLERWVPCFEREAQCNWLWRCGCGFTALKSGELTLSPTNGPIAWISWSNAGELPLAMRIMESWQTDQLSYHLV